MTRLTLDEWFATPLGAHVLARELSFCDDLVADIFGFNALQVGLPTIDMLRASRMPLRFALAIQPYLRAAPESAALGDEPAILSAARDATLSPAIVRANGSDLPIATQSMDLVLLPHVLEFAEDPHRLLREVDRIMMPEGRLIVIGFNPWSLWGLRQAFSGRAAALPWQGNFISLVRLKDWLSLLGFDVSAGRLGCYIPPVASERWLTRFQFMEAAGDRWWGIAGGVYMLHAIKRVQGMRLITPKWKERRVREGVVVPLSRRTPQAGGPHSAATADIIHLPSKK